MGCNTSKENPQDEKENKENQDHSGDGESDNKNNENNTKSFSARTITLRSNGTAKSIEENNRNSANSEIEASKGPDEEQAATKIQAAFRGHKTRKSMKQPAQNEEKEPTRQELENEFPLNDEELCHAATKIQASFRGHMTRKQVEGTKPGGSADTKDSKPEAEELDIDLTDPELSKAAQKIQASFRGHLQHRNKDAGQTADSK